MSRIFRGLLWLIYLILATGVAAYAYLFFTRIASPAPGADITGVLTQLRDRPIWFYMHMGGGGTAMLLGPWQLVSFIRNRWPVIHRYTGRIYILAVLVGGSAGFVMALNSDAGLIAQSGFATLAVFWLFSTVLAFFYGWRRQIANHRDWMIRSLALTIAAITLRLYIPFTMIVLQPNYGIGFDEAYPAIAWLCWIPNILVAEWIIQRFPYRGR